MWYQSHSKIVAHVFKTVLCLSLVGLNYGIPKDALVSTNFVVGRIAELEDFPFMTSLRIRSVHYCAATIIHPKWVITAAQCYQMVPLSDYSVVSSTQQLNSNTGIVHQVTNITLSPQENLAMVKIMDNFEKQPAVMAKNMLGNFEVGIIVGWGFTATPGTTPKELRMIHLRIMLDTECLRTYQDYQKNSGLICMMPAARHLGICTGDVGAPLIANGKIYAVARWRKNCLDQGPEVFYSLPYKEKWIQKILNDL